ncbi:MFS transporter [Actinoallomurus oryzae]
MSPNADECRWNARPPPTTACTEALRWAGAALGGVLIAWLGPTALLFVDGATFLASALLVHFGVPQFVHETSEPGVGRYLHGLKEGMSFLWHDRLQRWAVAMILVSNLLDIGLSQVLLPTYARDVLHDSRAFGLLLGAVGAGSVVGSIIYGAVGARLPRRMTFAVCFLIGAIPRPLVLAVDAPFWIAVGTTFVAGLAARAINPLLGVMQFERIPARLRARVLGAITAGAYAGMPLGGLLAGSLADIIDLKATLLLFTLIYLLASMPPFLSRAWQEFDRAKPSSGAAPKQDADAQREEIEHK